MDLNKAFDLLFLAKQNGLEIILNNDQLQLKYPKQKKVDKNLIEEIRNNKESLIEFLKERNNSGKSDKLIKFDREKIKHIPLSFSQERMWFIDQFE